MTPSNTPVLFIIFNRPETTQKVFEAIRQAKPRLLFVAADGPRPGKEGEYERCMEARKIATNVDWDCEVKTLFRDQNRGCGHGPAEAITWFFENVEQGIILEDDCLPNPSFFNFCEKLLDYYKNNSQIMHISGNNFQYGKKFGKASYYFSAYSHNWGWATWKRAWEKYRHKLDDLDDFLASEKFRKFLQTKEERKYWKALLEELRFGKEDVWDGQWQYSIWRHGGLSIIPNVNLVSNIGFGKDATHTISPESILSSIPTRSIGDITNPKAIAQNIKADQRGFKLAFIQENPSILFRFFRKAQNHMRRLNILKLFAKKFWQKKLKEGIVYRELKKISTVPRYTEFSTAILGKKIKAVDSASFVFMYKEIFNEQIYNINFSNKAPRIIDCGANIGLSCIYFKQRFPDAIITAFEPDKRICKIAKDNFTSFNFSDIELVNKGLWTYDGCISFMEEGADGGAIANNNQSDSVQVEVTKLSSYISQKIDFLKIDIEGAETEVLKESEHKLKLVENIFIEYHSFVGQKQTLSSILNILTEANFRIYIATPGLHSKNPFVQVNTYNGMDLQLNIFATR